MITSHDLWQQHHLPRFLIAASRVAITMLPPNVIMTNIKYLLTINERNSTHGTIYKPSRKEEGNLQRPRKRPTDLYPPLLTMANKTIGGCVRTPCPDVFCRYNDWIKNLFWLRSRIHPSGNYVEHQEREAPTSWVLSSSSITSYSQFDPQSLPLSL